MDLAINYDAIFENRLVVITGVARSGTTIIGKIVGSFENTHYLFEPSAFFLIPPLIQEGFLSKKEGGKLLKSILFEDFFLQMMQGRYVNFNVDDDSYIGNYVNVETVKKKWEESGRKIDAMKNLKENDYLFVIKIPDIQPFYGLLEEIFPGVKFIELIRDGNDIVSSSIRNDFYSAEDLNERLANWSYLVNDLRVPWFVEEKYKKIFTKWNYPTRVAYIWRVETEHGLKFLQKKKSNLFQFKLEEFTKDPQLVVKKMEDFVGRKRTDITNKHIDSVGSFKQREYPDNTPDIESPEKEKFISLREKLGYC